MLRKFKKAFTILREDGSKPLAKHVQRYIGKRFFNWREVHLNLVAIDDILAADWTNPPERKTAKPAGNRLTVHWVIPPPSAGGGGHQNIFRFVTFLEQAGHKCKVFSYDPQHIQSQEEADAVMKHYPKVKAKVQVGLAGLENCDAMLATGWQTAYPVFNSVTKAKKFYFVQDFEPYFYPLSSESVLAENTYRFGFYGVTAGRWLTEKLRGEYGMEADFYNFASDSFRYNFVNDQKRKGIFFYARPVTPRRGFELGVLALEQFHREHPDYTIHFAGWDTSEFQLSFPVVNHGSMKLDQLNELYNDCAAALVISLTNMSLLPLELLASGCIPVVNDAPNNRLVSNSPYIAYSPTSPAALAHKLGEIVDREDQVEYARKASASVDKLDWADSGKRVVEVIEREVHV